MGSSILARAPALVALLFFLPLLKSGLGTDSYATMLAALALGGLASIAFSGIGTVGRRLIGEAHGAGDTQAEASHFRNTIESGMIALIATVPPILLYGWLIGSPGWAIAISIFAPICALANIFDNVRFAYNEHYVTATLYLLFQIVAYAIGFLVPMMSRDPILAALVLMGPLFLASTCGALLLLRRRAYLLHGRHRSGRRALIGEGMRISLADGLMFGMLNLSVVWVDRAGSAALSAWFATLVRLFTSAMSPVVLLLTPLSAYVRLIWAGTTSRRKRLIITATVGLSIGYGLFAGGALFIATRYYLEEALHLASPGPWWLVLPIFLMLGAMIAIKSYSLVAYMVLDSRHLTNGATAILFIALPVSVLCAWMATPIATLATVSLCVAIPLVALLIGNARRALVAQNLRD